MKLSATTCVVLALFMSACGDNGGVREGNRAATRQSDQKASSGSGMLCLDTTSESDRRAILQGIPEQERSSVTEMSRLGLTMVIVRVGTIPGTGIMSGIRVLKYSDEKWSVIAVENHFG